MEVSFPGDQDKAKGNQCPLKHYIRSFRWIGGTEPS